MRGRKKRKRWLSIERPECSSSRVRGVKLEVGSGWSIKKKGGGGPATDPIKMLDGNKKNGDWGSYGKCEKETMSPNSAAKQRGGRGIRTEAREDRSMLCRGRPLSSRPQQRCIWKSKFAREKKLIWGLKVPRTLKSGLLPWGAGER